MQASCGSVARTFKCLTSAAAVCAAAFVCCCLLLLLLQFLCCEVAALQDAGQLRQLRVQTFAAIGWQLNMAQDTSDAIQAHKSVSSGGAPEFNMSAGAGVLAAGYEAELYGNRTADRCIALWHTLLHCIAL